MNTRKPKTPYEPTDVVEFIVHGALAPRLTEWLNSIGMNVDDWPTEGEELRAVMVTPCQELMDHAERVLGPIEEAPDGTNQR